jgi:hypothetical protein
MKGVGGGGITVWAGMPSGCHAGVSIVWMGGLNPKNKLFLRDMEFDEGKNFHFLSHLSHKACTLWHTLRRIVRVYYKKC